MPNPLKFKGDHSTTKDKKIKKKRKREAAVDAPVTLSPDEEVAATPWPICDQLLDLKGPLFIHHISSSTQQSILTSLEYERVSFRKPPKALSIPEPAHVSQVFVVRKTHPDSKFYSIKNSGEKFLGTDSIGGIYCERNAVGQSEQWEIVMVEGGFAFKSSFNRYLTYDVGEAVSIPARADSTEIGPNETFILQCQAENKSSFVKPKDREREAGQVEFDQLKMFHSIQASSFGERDLTRTKDDQKRLKKAKEEGNLNEMLLDRRSKSKSDKFC